MNSNCHLEREYSCKERNYLEINPINNYKHDRFHCSPYPKNYFMDSNTIGKNQNINLYDKINGLEMRRINDNIVRKYINRTDDMLNGIEYHRNTENNHCKCKCKNINAKYGIGNHDYIFDKYKLNYNIENIRRTNFDGSGGNCVNINNNIHQVKNDNIRNSVNELYKPLINYNSDLDLNKNKVRNNSLNNNQNRIDIENNNEEYRKRLKKHNIKINQLSNSLSEQKDYKKYNKTNSIDLQSNNILSYKSNDNIIIDQQQNQNFNNNKISPIKNDKEPNECKSEERVNNFKSIHKIEGDKRYIRVKSNHSFKYINEKSSEKMNRLNKSNFKNNNYYSSNYKFSPKHEINDSYKNTLNIEIQYKNDYKQSKKEQNKNNLKGNNIIKYYYRGKRSNQKYKPQFRKDNLIKTKNNEQSKNVTSKEIIKENENNNINNKYRNFLKKEIYKNIQNIYKNLNDIKNKNKNKEYNNISFKEIIEENKKNIFISNKSDKQYPIKAKEIKIDENLNNNYNTLSDRGRNDFNNTNCLHKNYSYNFYNKIGQPNDKEKLLNKYNIKKEIQRPASEKKYNLKLNDIEISKGKDKEEQLNKGINKPENNILKCSYKEEQNNEISKNGNLEKYNINRIQEEPILKKYQSDFRFSDGILKRYTSENKKTVIKNIYQISSNNNLKEQHNHQEEKYNPQTKNDDLLKPKKVLYEKKTQIINSNLNNKYKNIVKDDNISKKVISPVLEIQKYEHIFKNNFFKDNKNINDKKENNKEISKNNNKLNYNFNENFIKNNIKNNQINKERKAFSPVQVQHVKIRNQVFDNKRLNNNIQKSNQYINNKNVNVNNNTNINQNQSNNNAIRRINSNQNYKKYNDNINVIKQIYNSNIRQSNNSAQFINNNISDKVQIKNNFVTNNALSKKKVLMNNYNTINNTDKNSPIYNRIFSSQINQKFTNNQNALVPNNFNKNLEMFNSANLNNKNKIMIKNNSTPNIGRRKEVKIIKNCANGLQNIGATCYMNATLQCLANVENLTKNLLQRKEEIRAIEKINKLVNYYLEVLENLWENNSFKGYAPRKFKEIISKMNPLFQGVQANDSKDLVLFLLENMHSELNKVKNVNEQSEDEVDQYNFYNNLNSFTKYFQKNYQSIISDIFYGMYNSQMKCLNCNVITHNVQCYNLLIIPLEEVRLFKKHVQNTVTIYECFEYYQKFDNMTGQNQIFCNKCKKMSNSVNNTSLITCPKVLIINLNRGKGLQFDVKLNFDEFIDISQFIYFKKTPCRYQLIGIVTHFNSSGKSGHFIAFCKSFVDGNWYKYDDSIVSMSNFQEAKTTGVPYILFYSVTN